VREGAGESREAKAAKGKPEGKGPNRAVEPAACRRAASSNLIAPLLLRTITVK
jgi:hypothetical protein